MLIQTTFLKFFPIFSHTLVHSQIYATNSNALRERLLGNIMAKGVDIEQRRPQNISVKWRIIPPQSHYKRPTILRYDSFGLH